MINSKDKYINKQMLTKIYLLYLLRCLLNFKKIVFSLGIKINAST